MSATAAAAVVNDRTAENIFGEQPEETTYRYGLKEIIDITTNNETVLNKLDDQIAKGMHDLNAADTENFVKNIETFKNNINSTPVAAESVHVMNGMVPAAVIVAQTNGKPNGDVAIIDIVDEGELLII